MLIELWREGLLVGTCPTASITTSQKYLRSSPLTPLSSLIAQSFQPHLQPTTTYNLLSLQAYDASPPSLISHSIIVPFFLDNVSAAILSWY